MKLHCDSCGEYIKDINTEVLTTRTDISEEEVLVEYTHLKCGNKHRWVKKR